MTASERREEHLRCGASVLLIKARMHETQSPLAGEMSGHIFFADRFYGYDDAIYAGARCSSDSLSQGLPKPVAASAPAERDNPRAARMVRR